MHGEFPRDTMLQDVSLCLHLGCVESLTSIHCYSVPSVVIAGTLFVSVSVQFGFISALQQVPGLCRVSKLRQ